MGTRFVTRRRKKERRYEGELKDGEPNGHGTLTYHPSGTKYIGEFKDGNRWNGTEFDKNGKVKYKYVNAKIQE